MAVTTTSVRTSELTIDEITTFAEQGYLLPGRILSDPQLEEMRVGIQEHLEGKFATERYELLDPMIEGDASKPKGEQTVPFLFNLWRRDPRFRTVALDPLIGRWAAQLLGSPQVVLLEDGAVLKPPVSGGTLKWHQDYPFWPLATPSAVTCWIALDRTTLENGAMQVAPGTHLLGERLPVEFSSGRSFMPERGLPAQEEPTQVGREVVTVTLEPGECSLHHALTWHASGPNVSSGPRIGFIPRYVALGTIWLGSQRFPYNYTDHEVGVPLGTPIGGHLFPLVPTIA